MDKIRYLQKLYTIGSCLASDLWWRYGITIGPPLERPTNVLTSAKMRYAAIQVQIDQENARLRRKEDELHTLRRIYGTIPSKTEAQNRLRSAINGLCAEISYQLDSERDPEVLAKNVMNSIEKIRAPPNSKDHIWVDDEYWFIKNYKQEISKTLEYEALEKPYLDEITEIKNMLTTLDAEYNTLKDFIERMSPKPTIAQLIAPVPAGGNDIPSAMFYSAYALTDQVAQSAPSAPPFD